MTSTEVLVSEVAEARKPWVKPEVRVAPMASAENWVFTPSADAQSSLS